MGTDDKTDKVETDLRGHHRHKKILKPPLARLDFTFSSWLNVRMPDMLWAALAHHGLGRDAALKLFRHVADFSAQHPECYEVTHTSIGGLPTEMRTRFIQHLLAGHKDAALSLRPLTLFPELPGFAEWKAELGEAPDQDGQALAESVEKVLWHQSEEATDCRWAKVLCRIVSGKMKFAPTMTEMVRELIEYPNYGDMRKVRPSIRSAEIGPMFQDEGTFTWPKAFWLFCFDGTPCIPQSSLETDLLTEDKEWAPRRQFYLEETQRVHLALVEHSLRTATSSGIDSRHESSFGFALYALTLFIEVVLHRLDHSVSGRSVLRTLAECAIVFAYLLKKDEKDLWDEYRSYGAGQAKLAYLKMKELAPAPQYLDETMLERVANEDVWQEFVSINLGNWDNSDLRKMSEESQVKDIYDRYYGPTSNYVHANWAALRETTFELCLNPLHRHHRLPLLRLPYLNPLAEDARQLANRALELVALAYPEFQERIKRFTPTPIQTTPSDSSVEDDRGQDGS